MKIRYILIFLVLVGCNTQEKTIVLEGDIYIKLIDFTNLYGASDELKANVTKQIKNYGNSKGNEDEMSQLYKKLDEYNLLFSPHFKLKLENGNIVDVFTTEKEITLLKDYLKDFNRDEEKIYLKLKAIKKEDNIYYTEKIILINKTKGITDWAK